MRIKLFPFFAMLLLAACATQSGGTSPSGQGALPLGLHPGEEQRIGRGGGYLIGRSTGQDAPSPRAIK